MFTTTTKEATVYDFSKLTWHELATCLARRCMISYYAAAADIDIVRGEHGDDEAKGIIAGWLLS